MNKLPLEKQTLVLSHLVEGSSIRSIERITGIHREMEIMLYEDGFTETLTEKQRDALLSEKVIYKCEECSEEAQTHEEYHIHTWSYSWDDVARILAQERNSR